MIGRLAALILLSTLSHTTDIPHQIPLTVAEVGENVTLSCPMTGHESGLFYWYKLRSGYMVQTIAAGSLYKISLQGQFNSSRFTFTKENSLYFLHLTHVSKDDEATYICQSGAAYTIKFTNATVLVVKEPKNQRKSFHVRQTPETASFQPDESMTLQCSLLSRNEEDAVQCPSEQNVYWFRAGSGESHPSIIYTQRNSDEQDGRSCNYSLSKQYNASDNGTYYCAVVTCGEILFGEGTKVETRQKLCPFVIALGTLLACCVVAVIALVITRNQKPVCKHCKGDVRASSRAEHERTHEDQSYDVGREEVAGVVNYAALDFPSRKSERWMNTRDSSLDCTYSGMRDYE